MQNHQKKRSCKAAILVAILCIMTIATIPAGAQTIRPAAWHDRTIATTEYNVRSWALYGIDFDDYEGYPYTPAGDFAILDFVFDGLIVTEHKYNATTSGTTFVRSYLYISAYDYLGWARIDQETGVLTVDWGDDQGDYGSFDLTTGNYSVWFIPLGYVDEQKQAENLYNLDQFHDSLTSSNASHTFHNYVGTAEEVTRTAMGAYNLLARKEAIAAKNADEYIYQKGFDQGEDVGYQNGLAEGQARGEATAYNERTTFFSFVNAMFAAPAQIINTLFDFDLFGFNVANVFKVIITMLALGFVIKLFIKYGGA